MSSPVQFSRQGAIALITVDNPPVNALGQPVRAALLDAFRQAEADATVQAVVLCCAGKTFMAGADIREFGLPPKAPILPDVVEAIEACAKPSVAVIHGSALGGGLEVAMACHYRIGRCDASFGLPEVKLGLLPGAGGTQRLPRLVGVARALRMIVSGTPIGTAEALACGLLDDWFEHEPPAAGLAFAERLLAEGRGPRRSGEQNDKLATADAGEVFASKRREVEQGMSGLFSPLRAIDAVEAAIRLPLREGLKRERELFLECLQSPQRAGLVHAFLAERKAGRIDDLPSDTPIRPISSVAVVGGGTMGVGIALCFANAGIPVMLLEIDAQALERALTRARDTYAISVKRGSLSEEAMQQRLALIAGASDYRELAEVDLVVEAVFEDMAAKRQVFAALDAVCKPGAILASNTSSLDLNLIAACTRRPQDVVGLHFFSPANVMRLLEVVRGAETGAEVLATAMQLARRLKKVAVTVGVCDGFVGNRMMLQLIREAELLLEEGATPAQVDRALQEFGLAMGPFVMQDLSGLDIWQRMRQRQRETLGEGGRLPGILDQLCAAGRLGQKSGAGYYRYESGSRKPHEDAQLNELWGRPSRTISDSEIVERTLYALINEGARLLEEGIVQRASDIDVIFLTGYGFPAWRGGPMFHADRIGLGNVLVRSRDFQQCYGANWEPAPLLKRLVAEQLTFAEHDSQR